jgi:hypothetical protein
VLGAKLGEDCQDQASPAELQAEVFKLVWA